MPPQTKNHVARTQPRAVKIPTGRRRKTRKTELEPRASPRIPELEAARKEIESLLYSVSHDLRAPLRAVGGFTKKLLKKFSTQMPLDAQVLISRVDESTERMGHLVDGLLCLSRLGRQPMARESVQVSALVRKIVEELAHEQTHRPIKIQIGALLDCVGDASSLREIFVNLLANAFQFTRAKKVAVIRVGSRRARTGTVYFVRDNGVGFNRKDAGKLFGTVPRRHTLDGFEEVGVGLSIVQRLVTRQGGRVWAEARAEGRGSTFYFSLPHHATRNAGRIVRARPEEKIRPAAQTRLRILVLEDDLRDRELIRARLESENIDCEMIFTSGRGDFEAALHQGGLNLILSDYSLPQFDGIKALRLVREKDPDLPFILISGTLGEEQAVECLKLGATDYVLKQRLVRLGPAIHRALEETQVRVKQRRADEAMRELSRRLLRLQDEERRRVARELHDSVAQNLVALEVNLSSAQRRVPASESKVKLLLADCAALADETAKALRTVSYLLHPPVLDSLGLPGALQDFVEGFGRRSGIKVILKVPPKFGRLPGEIETALYRIVQESLTNIHRHSGSASATIDLRRGRDTIVLEIQDAGRGIPSETLRGPGTSGSIGVGIAGMRERLQLLQGRLEIESSPAGTRVRAVVPYGGAA